MTFPFSIYVLHANMTKSTVNVMSTSNKDTVTSYKTYGDRRMTFPISVYVLHANMTKTAVKVMSTSNKDRGRMQTQRLDLRAPTQDTTTNICKQPVRLIVTLMTHC